MKRPQRSSSAAEEQPMTYSQVIVAARAVVVRLNAAIDQFEESRELDAERDAT